MIERFEILILVVLAVIAMIVLTVSIAYEVRRRHKERKRIERRCTFPILENGIPHSCNCDTTRYYRMRRRRGKNGERWWNWSYEYEIVDLCSREHAMEKFTHPKLFRADELILRLFINNYQFRENPRLDDLEYHTKVLIAQQIKDRDASRVNGVSARRC